MPRDPLRKPTVAVIGTGISDHRGVLAELTLSGTEKMVVKSPVYGDISF